MGRAGDEHRLLLSAPFHPSSASTGTHIPLTKRHRS